MPITVQFASKLFISLSDMAVIPPTRWLAAVLTPLLIIAHSLRKKSLDKSGGILGMVIIK